MKRLISALAILVVAPVALVAAVTAPGPESGSAASGPSEQALGEIPEGLLEVYVAAAARCPGLDWSVLAGIGWIESRHGGRGYDPATGDVRPAIIGPAIDGRPGFATIRDAGQPDGWARAFGPMQFLSTTWTRWATLAPDRHPGSAPDVNNAWDAIYSAARYLCGGRQRIDNIESALLRYNPSSAYVTNVIAKAADYGLAEREP